jgi:hypothetical protein
MDATRRQPRWLNWTSALFVIAVMLFANSMFLPFGEQVHPEHVNPEQEGEPIWGIDIAVMSFFLQIGGRSGGSNGVHTTHIDIVTYSVWYSLANLSFLTTLFFGWNLCRRRPIAMWAVSVLGLSLGLTAPLIARPDDGSSVILNEYRSIGYWIWIAALALIALSWGILVRQSRSFPAAVSRIHQGVRQFIGQFRQDVSSRLFAVAAALFAVSLFAPVVGDEVNGAWAVYFTFWLSALGAVAIWFPQNPYGIWEHRAVYLALFANLSLLTTARWGRKLRHRSAMAMLAFAVLGLVSACIVPANAWQHRHGYSINFIEYRLLGISYWLWIATLAFVASGWGSVVWNQRQVRNAAIRSAMATTIQPPSGESN